MQSLWHADIALPKNNEQDFIKIALKLGLKEIIFLYDKKSTIPSLESKDIKITLARKVQKNELSALQSLKKKFTYLVGGPDRACFENKTLHFITGMESEANKDHTHYRNSGMDQIFAKIAKEKNKTICLDLSQLDDRAVMGRMMQNVRLCDKYAVPVLVFSFATKPFLLRAAEERKAFLRSLR